MSVLKNLGLSSIGILFSFLGYPEAKAMDTADVGVDVKEQRHSQVSQTIKNQIKSIKKYADERAGKNETVSLILGSANVEVDALKDASKAKQYVFWNLSFHQGDKSDPTLNPFIDASFNDKDILQYASKKLKGKIVEIIVPEQVIEYTRWKMPDFLLLRQMLAPQGSLTFALSWMGENSTLVTHPATKLSDDLLSEEFINTLNRYDLSYEERERYIAEKGNKSFDQVFAYVSNVGLPSLSARNKTLDLSELPPLSVEDEEKVKEYTGKYLALIEPYKHLTPKDAGFEDAAANLKFTQRNDPLLRLLLARHAVGLKPFFKEAEVKEYFTRTLSLEVFRKKAWKAYQAAKEQWLKREFGKSFSAVTIEDIDRNDSVINDIPSRVAKLGSRVIHLTK